MRTLGKVLKIGLLVVIGLFVVYVTGRYFSLQSSTVGCPVLAFLAPIRSVSIESSDYIEYDILPGFSSWDPVHVRIYGDGHIERETTWTLRDGSVRGCPLHSGDKQIRIDPQLAKQLISHANQAGFCRLCSVYRSPSNVTVLDASTEVLQLSIGGKIKRVAARAGSPPPLFDELIRSVDQLSPMDALADTDKFTPEREAQCRLGHL